MVEIRKATRMDGDKAFEIRESAIWAECSDYYPIEKLRIWTAGEVSDDFLNDVESNFYAAEIDSELVGTGKVSLDTGKLDAIFVDPQHMGKGVGTTMLNFLEQVARTNGMEMLTLESTLNAAKFYRNRGFVGDEIAI